MSNSIAGRRWGVAWAILVLWVGSSPAWCEEFRPAVTIRAVRPGRQWEQLIALFEGARAPHPAAALAAWRRATGETLGKATEAIITLFNPEMARELRLLDGAEFQLAFGDGGRVRWFASLPRDDGTLSAMATALVLTEGAAEPPLGTARVDRLGPPGSPLLAQAAGGVAIAATRDDLQIALEPRRRDPAEIETGWLVRLDLEALAGSAPWQARQVAEGLRALGCRELDGVAGLDGDALSLALTGRLASPPPMGGAIDPDWLDWVPAQRTLAAFALALDPRREAWDAVFAAADRIEKADPARAKLAPIRTRLDLLAIAAGVRPEAELWPRLLGLTACLRTDDSGTIDGGLIALHTVGDDAAERIATVILPRLSAAWGLAAAGDPEGADGRRLLGRAAGRPLEATRRGATVLIGWGEGMLAAGLDATDHPERSAGPSIRSGWGGARPRRAGALWPGRLA
ncbi:MAG: hypothetical protein IRY99_17325, partial [Isosphaeraceae bacterium]|nr:hypothetical protein [Isosphaeraceae bacterium]